MDRIEELNNTASLGFRDGQKASWATSIYTLIHTPASLSCRLLQELCLEQCSSVIFLTYIRSIPDERNRGCWQKWETWKDGSPGGYNSPPASNFNGFGPIFMKFVTHGGRYKLVFASENQWGWVGALALKLNIPQNTPNVADIEFISVGIW